MIFVDANVLMYAAGAGHPLKVPCMRFLDGVANRAIDGVTSVGVIQELVHRYLSIGRAEGGLALAEQSMDLFAPVLPITHALIRRVPDLAKRYPTLAARDLVHVATCIHEGIPEIVSTDGAFDAVREVRRVAPEDFVLRS